jgi:hypothetical protein
LAESQNMIMRDVKAGYKKNPNFDSSLEEDG